MNRKITGRNNFSSPFLSKKKENIFDIVFSTRNNYLQFLFDFIFRRDILNLNPDSICRSYSSLQHIPFPFEKVLPNGARWQMEIVVETKLKSSGNTIRNGLTILWDCTLNCLSLLQLRERISSSWIFQSLKKFRFADVPFVCRLVTLFPFQSRWNNFQSKSHQMTPCWSKWFEKSKWYFIFF